jgi:type I restriction enzyme R subunit
VVGFPPDQKLAPTIPACVTVANRLPILPPPISPIRMPTEADTCRKFVVPKLLATGWDDEPHSIAEQRTITDGRIIPAGKGFIRKPPKRVDYLLRYARDFPLAVVEAKAGYKSAADGLQQAKV